MSVLLQISGFLSPDFLVPVVSSRHILAPRHGCAAKYGSQQGWTDFGQTFAEGHMLLEDARIFRCFIPH
jgi:hypothetical protein